MCGPVRTNDSRVTDWHHLEAWLALISDKEGLSNHSHPKGVFSRMLAQFHHRDRFHFALLCDQFLVDGPLAQSSLFAAS